MLRECDEDPTHNAEPVGSSVQREIDPRVGVSLPGRRGEIGRVREDSVERPEAPGEVCDHDLDREPLGPSGLGEAAERGHVPVRQGQ